MTNHEREVVVLDDVNALADDATRRVADSMRTAVATRGRFVIALSGGSTPKALHARLVAMDVDALPWARTTVVFGDERCVPPDDPASNYGMARDTLLAHVPVPEAHVLRMEGEREPADGAERYEAMLRGLATQHGVRDDEPLFDLVLLGVGPDGHTASLFPGSPALDEDARWVVHTQAPPGMPVRDRLTLSLPALARARALLVLAAGAEKQAVIARALAGDAALPAARVRGHTTWLLDRAAAGER